MFGPWSHHMGVSLAVFKCHESNKTDSLSIRASNFELWWFSSSLPKPLRDKYVFYKHAWLYCDDGSMLHKQYDKVPCRPMDLWIIIGQRDSTTWKDHFIVDLVENMQLNLFNGEEITFIESNMMLHDLFKASFEVILFLHPLYLLYWLIYQVWLSTNST